MKSIGANKVVYLSDTPPTLSPLKGRAVATAFITSTKTKLAKAAMRAGKYGAMSLSQPQVSRKDLPGDLVTLGYREHISKLAGFKNLDSQTLYLDLLTFFEWGVIVNKRFVS